MLSCLLFVLYIGPDDPLELFTSILYNLYVAPEGFCFDAFCNDDPILDNRKLHGYNVNEKVIIKHQGRTSMK